MLIDVKNLFKIYHEGEESEVRALDGVSLSVDRGEFLAIIGQSGSGKSTLMNILGCLDIPTYGDYHLDGVDVTELSDRQLAHIRNKQIGFIFQGFNLIPALNAWENVELPLIYPVSYTHLPTIAIETDKSGVYQANAYYVMGAGDEVKLLVVDTYGNIPAVDSVTTVTDESNLGTALKQYTDVTFEGDATISSKLEIPAGATLNVKGDLTANAAIVGNGTLNVTGNISDTSKVSTQLESTKTSETVSVSGGVVLGDVTGNVGSGSALYSGDQVKGKVIVQITVPADAVTGGTSKIKFDGSEPSTPKLTNRSDIYLAIDMSQSGQKVITIDKDGDWSSTANDVYTLTVKW